MRALRSGRFPGRRAWLREALVSVGCMLVLSTALFPDVLLLGRTTATSATAPGVLGSPPHVGYPEGPVRENNPYLRDRLASAIASEPAAEYVSRIVDDPGLALWDPYRSLGQPFLATGDPQLVSPIRWPLAAFPTPVGWDLFNILRLVATGVLVHLLAWRLGWSRWSCITASVVASAGGFTALHINSVHTDQLVALAIGMHAVLWFSQSRRPESILAVGAAGAVVLISDNVQAGVLGLLYLTAFSAHLLHRQRTRLRRTLGMASLVTLVPILLSAVVLLPLGELAGTPLNAGLSVHRHAGERLVGLAHLHPQALADVLVPYIGHDAAPGFDINIGIGLAIALLALLGLRAGGPHRRFLVVAAVLLLLKMFGTPVLNSLGGIPVLRSVNFLLYGSPPLQLTLALLAAAGVERLREQSVSGSEALSTALVLWLVTWSLVVWRLPEDVDRTGLLAVHLLLMAAVAGVVAWGASPTSVRWQPAAATALVGLQVLVVWLPQLGAVTPDAQVERLLGLEVVDRPFRSDPFAVPPFVEAILRESEPDDRVVARGGMLFPNTAGVFGLRDLRGTSAFTVSRFHGLVGSFIDRRDPWRFDGRGWDGLVDPLAHPRLPEILDLVGVEWIISHGPLPDAREADRPPELRPVFSGPHAVVYRNPDAFPGAFLVHDVVVVDSPAAALDRMGDHTFDLRETAVLETSSPPEVRPPVVGTATVDVLDTAATRSRFHVATPTPAVLVVSDTFYPGWEARIDGTTVEVMPAYGALRAVTVPAGSSTVEFAFRPMSVLIGGVVSAATLVSLLLAVVISRVRRRRSAGPTHNDRGVLSTELDASEAEPRGS